MDPQKVTKSLDDMSPEELFEHFRGLGMSENEARVHVAIAMGGPGDVIVEEEPATGRES